MEGAAGAESQSCLREALGAGQVNPQFHRGCQEGRSCPLPGLGTLARCAGEVELMEGRPGRRGQTEVVICPERKRPHPVLGPPPHTILPGHPAPRGPSTDRQTDRQTDRRTRVTQPYTQAPLNHTATLSPRHLAVAGQTQLHGLTGSQATTYSITARGTHAGVSADGPVHTRSYTHTQTQPHRREARTVTR